MIIASCIGFQNVIVADDKLSPTIRPVVLKMLERLPRYDTKVSYQYESHTYHIQVENELQYVCISDQAYQLRTVYAFLEAIKDKFKTQFGESNRYPQKSEITARKCSGFSSVLSAQTKIFNENPAADKIGRIKDEIDSVKQIMLENLDNLIERGDRIDNLCDKTEMLKEEAQGFHNNATTLKRKMWMRNVKIAIAVFLLLCLVGLVIAFIACGIDFHKCKSDSPAPAPAPEPPASTTP